MAGGRGRANFTEVVHVLRDFAVLVWPTPVAKNQWVQWGKLAQVPVEVTHKSALQVQPKSSISAHQDVPQEVCPGGSVFRVDASEALLLSLSLSERSDAMMSSIR